MKRILVTMTKETGDDVSVSVKVNDNKSFTLSEKKKLMSEVSKKILPDVCDALYFKVRYNEKVGKSKGITKSIKVSTITELNSEITNVFSKLGVSDE